MNIITAEGRLRSAIEQFFDAGGKIDRAHALIDHVNSEWGAAAGQSMSRDSTGLASAPQTDRSEGHVARADLAVPYQPSLRHPGHARRGALAIASVQGAVAKSLFDSTLLEDGRRLRDVRWAELDSLSGRYRRLSRVFTAIRNIGTPADPQVFVTDVVTEDRLQEIFAEVEMVNDVA